MKRSIYHLILFLLIIFIITSCDQDSRVVGTVGNYQITVKEFKEILAKKYPKKAISEITIEEREMALTEFMDNKLRVLGALDLDMEEIPKVAQMMEQRRRRVIAAKYPEILITDKLVDPEMIQAYKDLQEFNIDLAVVALGYRGGNLIKSGRPEKLTMALANQLYNKIKDGDSTAAISEIYSDMSAVKANKGRFPQYQPLTFDPEADIHIRRARSGQLLQPFKTAGGIYIIEIFEKSEKEEDRKSAMDDNRIKWQIYNKFYRQLGDSLYKGYTKEFSEEFGTKIVDEGVDEFLKAIEAWAQNPAKEDTTFTETQSAIILARIGDEEITAGDFINEFQGTFTSNYLRFNDRDRLKKMLEDYVDRFLVWIKKAEADGIDQLPEVQEALTEFRDNQLIDIFDRLRIQPFSQPTPEEVDAYYERNKENYRIPEKLKIWEIIVQDEKLAGEILQEARSSDVAFEDLAKKYSVSPSGKERGGALGYLDIKANRPYIDEAFKAGENQIIGPIEDKKNYYIIKTGDMLSEQVRSREEIEPTLRLQAQNAKADSIRTEIFNELKTKHKYQINENILKSIN